MANTHTTLASLFDDTADAIREKKGTTAAIVADNFPAEIRSIEDVTAEVNAQLPIVKNIKEALVGKATGANATADKILEGYSAYVGQELVVGTAKSGVIETIYENIATDEILFSSNTDIYGGIELSHSLRIIPKIAILQAQNESDITTDYHVVRAVWVYDENASQGRGYFAAKYKGTNAYGNLVNYGCTMTNTTVEATSLGSGVYLTGGVKYNLITMS